MFQRVDENGGTLRLEFEGRRVLAGPGVSVAAALLAAGVTTFRDTPASGSPRGPYCMMGVCFDCLVEIDGAGNRQACMTPARDGMVIRRQHGAREVA
jgi:predicted molibdopterin-dependent oxidoreductase YjgC